MSFSSNIVLRRRHHSLSLLTFLFPASTFICLTSWRIKSDSRKVVVFIDVCVTFIQLKLQGHSNDIIALQSPAIVLTFFPWHWLHTNNLGGAYHKMNEKFSVTLINSCCLSALVICLNGSLWLFANTQPMKLWLDVWTQ